MRARTRTRARAARSFGPLMPDTAVGRVMATTLTIVGIFAVAILTGMFAGSFELNPSEARRLPRRATQSRTMKCTIHLPRSNPPRSTRALACA